MKTRFVRLLVVVLAGAVLGLAPAGWAQDGVRASNATPPLRLREAIAESLAASPRLRPVSEQLESAAIQQALAASRFGLKVTPQVTTGRDPYALTQRTLGVAVSRRLPFGTEVQANANTYEYGTSPNDVRDAGYGFLRLNGHAAAVAGLRARDECGARVRVDGSTRRLEDARQQLVVDATAAYLNVLRQERLVDASESARERHQAERDVRGPRPRRAGDPTRRAARVVPVPSIFEADGAKYVIVARGDRTGRRTVSVLGANDSLAAVKGRVTPGERVLLIDPDTERR